MGKNRGQTTVSDPSQQAETGPLCAAQGAGQDRCCPGDAWPTQRTLPDCDLQERNQEQNGTVHRPRFPIRYGGIPWSVLGVILTVVSAWPGSHHSDPSALVAGCTSTSRGFACPSLARENWGAG